MAATLNPELVPTLVQQIPGVNDPEWLTSVWSIAGENLDVATALARHEHLPVEVIDALAALRDERVRVALCTNGTVDKDLRLSLLFSERRSAVATRIVRGLSAPLIAAVCDELARTRDAVLATALVRNNGRVSDPRHATVVIETILTSGRSLNGSDNALLRRFIVRHARDITINDTAVLAATDHEVVDALTATFKTTVSAAVARHVVEVRLQAALEKGWVKHENATLAKLTAVLEKCDDLTGVETWFAPLAGTVDIDEYLARFRDTIAVAELSIETLRNTASHSNRVSCTALAAHPDAVLRDKVRAVMLLDANAGELVASFDDATRFEVLCQVPDLAVRAFAPLIEERAESFVTVSAAYRTQYTLEFMNWLGTHPAALRCEKWQNVVLALRRQHANSVLPAAVAALQRESLGDNPARWAAFADLSSGFGGTTGELFELCVALNQ